MARHHRPRDHRPTTPDPVWAIADGIELQAAELPDHCLGAITARRHPTGWFIAGHYRRGLDADDLADVKQFVTVRGYLLLTAGPQPELFEPTWIDGEWRAWTYALVPDSADLVPDTVPSSW